MVETLEVEMVLRYEVSPVDSSMSSNSSRVSSRNASMPLLFKGGGICLIGVEVSPPKPAGITLMIPTTLVDGLTWVAACEALYTVTTNR